MKSQQNKCKKLWRLLEDWDEPKRLFRPHGTLDCLFCTSAVCGQGLENDLKLGEETRDMWTVLIMFCCCDIPAVQSSTAERQIIKTSWIKKSLRLQEHIFTVMTVCVNTLTHSRALDWSVIVLTPVVTVGLLSIWPFLGVAQRNQDLSFSDFSSVWKEKITSWTDKQHILHPT